MRLLLLAALIATMLSPPDGDPARYYIAVDTQEEAEAIADKIGGDLLTYTDGIATYTINRPLKKALRGIGIDTYNPEETAEIDGEAYTLTRDNVYYLDDFEKGTNPVLNENFQAWPFEKIEWGNTYKNNITGAGAVVAVLDTGCDITHEDLRDNIIGGYNAVDGTQNVADLHGHGTHVSGTILARDNTVGNVGVAPDAKLYVVKVFTRLDNGKDVAYTSDVIKGLNKCIELGNINVVNMSLGGNSYDANFRDAMDRCMEHGILTVVAAGNEGTDEPHYPAAFGIGLRVAAYGENGKLTYFSNYGDNANIAAPGSRIYSTYPGGLYTYLSGTSMASPEVAGVAALIYGSKDIPKNRAGANQVMHVILDNVDKKTYSYKDHSVTGGVDVQSIFHSNYIRTPQTPAATTKEQADTGQIIVTLTSNADIIYTLDGSTPSLYNGKHYTDPIRLDKAGTYKLRAVAYKKRCGSQILKKKIEVKAGVISQERIESASIAGKKKIAPGKTSQMNIVNDGAPIPANRWTWSTNKAIATVDSSGRVTVSSQAKSGATFKVMAKLGDVTTKKKITVK